MELNRIIAVRNNKTVYRDGKKVYKVFTIRESVSPIGFGTRSSNESVNEI